MKNARTLLPRKSPLPPFEKGGQGGFEKGGQGGNTVDTAVIPAGIAGIQNTGR